MTTFLVTLAVVLLTVAAMALGAIIQGKRLRGSCGLTADDCTCSALQARLCSRGHGPGTAEEGGVELDRGQGAGRVVQR